MADLAAPRMIESCENEKRRRNRSGRPLFSRSRPRSCDGVTFEKRSIIGFNCFFSGGGDPSVRLIRKITDYGCRFCVESRTKRSRVFPFSAPSGWIAVFELLPRPQPDIYPICICSRTSCFITGAKYQIKQHCHCLCRKTTPFLVETPPPTGNYLFCRYACAYMKIGLSATFPPVHVQPLEIFRLAGRKFRRFATAKTRWFLRIARINIANLALVILLRVSGGELLSSISIF